MDLRIYPVTDAPAADACRFGKVSISRTAPGLLAERADADAETVRIHGAAHIVVQKGRSFQRANPSARVVVDAGRYLVIDWTGPEPWVEDPGCFAVIPYADGAIDFAVRRAAAATRRDAVAALADRIEAEALKAKVVALAVIHTRESTGRGFLEALDLCEGWLAAAGCTVERQPFPIDGGQSFNLIAERKGRAADPRLFLMGGHLDSVNHEDGPGSRAPGADDNASGTVAVVETALALTALDDLEHDIRFILFGGEEQGLFGSRHFIGELSPAERQRVGGMLNVDMAASKNTANPSVLLEGAPLSQAMIDGLATAAATYTTLETQVSLSPFASDHVPFIQRGVPAVLTIEGSDDAYAFEHTAGDVVSNLDFELHRQIVRMNTAWLAQQVAPGL